MQQLSAIVPLYVIDAAEYEFLISDPPQLQVVMPFFDTKGVIYVTKNNIDPVDVCICSSDCHPASLVGSEQAH